MRRSTVVCRASDAWHLARCMRWRASTVALDACGKKATVGAHDSNVLRAILALALRPSPNYMYRIEPALILSVSALFRPADCAAVHVGYSHGAVSGPSFGQSLQYTLRTTARLKQSACRHRLPPPCAMQCCVPPEAAAVVQPAS